MNNKLLGLGLSNEQYLELRSQLENHFECLFLKNDSTIEDVITSWQPTLILISDHFDCANNISLIRDGHLYPSNIFPAVVIIATQYSLKDENDYFKMGCDLYLLARTPISSIINRLQALAKRVSLEVAPLPQPVQALAQGHYSSNQTNPLHEHTSYEDLELWPAQQRALYKGTEVHLTPIQFKLLTLFLVNMDQIIDRKSISQMIWKSKSIHPRTVDAHITKLKRALPFLEDKIINIYGKGYRLVMPNKKAA